MSKTIRPIEISGLLNACNSDYITKDLTSFEKLYDTLTFYETSNEEAHIADPFAKEIAQFLRHITVNPNNIFTTHMLLSSYVYPDVPLESHSIANLNSDATQFFVDYLVRTAQRERILSLSQDDIVKGTATHDTCANILTGERGCGKTFFLNYLLSKYASYLNNEKIVWVRLNLVYHSEFESDLVGWMLAQTAKIVLRYYDKKTQYAGPRLVDVIDHLIEWINSTNILSVSEDRRLYRQKLSQMITAFSSLGSDRPLSPGLCDKLICDEIFLYMRQIGWSFVLIVDGFDQLDINPEQAIRFNRIKDQIVSFLSFRANFGAALLIVSRTKTFDEFRAIDPFQNIPPSGRFKIIESDFKSVVERRIYSIKKEYIEKLPHHRKDYADRFGKLLEDFYSALLLDSDFYVDNKNAFMANMRSRMQLLYLNFLNFVDEKTGKGYQVIEHMMLNGHRLPAVAYEYGRNADGLIEFIPSRETSHESRFLPIITRNSYKLELDASIKTLVGGLLANVRCIQIANAAYELREEMQIATVQEVVNICRVLFSYKEDIVEACIKELSAFDILRTRGIDLVGTSRMSLVIPLPKAKFLMNDCMTDVAYLNMCAMRSFVPSCIIDTGKIKLAGLKMNGDSLNLWVEKKISNGCFLFRLLCCASEFERERAGDINRLSSREKRFATRCIELGAFSYFKNIADSFSVKTVNIIDASLRNRTLSHEEYIEVCESVRRSVSS